MTYLQVAGRAGVPADATAAVLNITVTNPRSDGFITVYPCGSPLPNASNLNYTTNQTTPNAVIAKIGDNGQVCIYTLAATHLITDINGYFPSGSPYTSMAPARLLETRPELATTDTGSNNGGSNNGGVRPAGSVTYLQVAGRAGVPADATAAVLNITVTNPRSDGFITVYPCGSPLPNASNLNYTTNQTTPNAVIAKIGDNGQVCIYTLAATHLITDINGYFPT